jgi:HSP20 family protein
MVNETTLSKSPAETVSQAEQTRCGLCFRPNVDIVEMADELRVLADVPGATPDGIDIDFHDGVLSLHAKVPPRHEEENYSMREYGVGDYYRTFQISEAIDASKISAELAEGVLTLHMPKSEAVKPRKIAVNAS